MVQNSHRLTDYNKQRLFSLSMLQSGNAERGNQYIPGLAEGWPGAGQRGARVCRACAAGEVGKKVSGRV